MPVKLSYSIKPVDVVEASASTNPDDLSIVPLRILVALQSNATATVFLDHINIVVRIPGQPSVENIESVKTKTLTARPKSITPVAGQFNVWELKFDSERTAADTAIAALGVNEAVFRANPVTTGTARTIAVVPGSTQQPFEFTLRDLEVVDHDGETAIVIEEFTRATADPASALTMETQILPVQKVFPALRIERFVASPPVTIAGVAVQLSWTTKGAEGEVELEGFPRERTAIVTGPPTTGGDPVVPTGDTPTSALVKSVLHTGTQEVSPRVTTTYTLRASNGASAKVGAQVTVTVQDLTVAPALAIGDDSFSRSHRPAAGALQAQGNVEAQGSVTAASVDARGLVHAQAVTADGVITGGSFTTTGTVSAAVVTGIGTVPFGTVVMWIGDSAHPPDGWTVCDGKTVRDPHGNSFLVPDLGGKFIIGASDAFPLKTAAGGNTVTLTSANMPLHTHGALQANGTGKVTTDQKGSHGHRLLRNDSDGNPHVQGAFGQAGASDDHLCKGTFKTGGDALTIEDSGDHTHDIILSPAGSAAPTAVTLPLPPFVALVFIMKTA